MERLEFDPSQFQASATVGIPVVGQYFDQDLMGSTGKMLTGFYESGQLWAVLIGVVIGYSLKSFSSYG
jgi:hypothetical protein